MRYRRRAGVRRRAIWCTGRGAVRHTGEAGRGRNWSDGRRYCGRETKVTRSGGLVLFTHGRRGRFISNRSKGGGNGHGCGKGSIFAVSEMTYCRGNSEALSRRRGICHASTQRARSVAAIR